MKVQWHGDVRYVGDTPTHQFKDGEIISFTDDEITSDGPAHDVKAYVAYTYPDKNNKPKRYLREIFIDPSFPFAYAHHALMENPFDNPYIVAISLQDGDIHICVAERGE